MAVGAAIGQACLLLAAGKKGRRFMMPHAKGKNYKKNSHYFILYQRIYLFLCQ